MSDMTYAVHTATCTYLLDDDGVCRWTHAPIGVAPPGAERCVGAQFVACLDLRAEGGLVGELRLGGAALFVREEEGRFVLLRTLPIESVEIRGPIDAGQALRPPPPPIDDPHSFAETPIFAHLEDADLEIEPLPSLPLDPETEPFPAFPFNPEETAPLDPRWALLGLGMGDPQTPGLGGEPLDLEDLLSISVTEVTLSLPLYRLPPDAPVTLPPPNPPPLRQGGTATGAPAPERPQPPHPPPRPRVIGPGRRLR